MKYLDIDRIIEVDTIEQLFINLFAFCNTPENSSLIFKHLRQTPGKVKINREIWWNYFEKEVDVLWRWRTINVKKLSLRIKQVCNGKGKSDTILLYWTLLEALEDEMIKKFSRPRVSTSQWIKCYNSEEYVVAPRLHSPFRKEYERRNAAGYGFRSAKEFESKLSDYLQHIIVMRVPMSYNIRFLSVERTLKRLLQDLKSELTVGVFSVGRGIEYAFKSQSASESETNYIFDNIINSDEVNEQLKNILRFATSEQVHIIVLPELTVDQGGRETISQFLMSQSYNPVIMMVIAGSYHINSESGEYVNEAVVFSYDGRYVRVHESTSENLRYVEWHQRKANAFNLIAKDIEKLRNAQNSSLRRLSQILHDGTTESYEMITESREIILVDTPLGRMAVAICRDFIATEFFSCLRGCRADMVFVPAMTPTLKEFEKRCQDLGRSNQAAVFIANSDLLAAKDCPIAKVYLPWKPKNGEPSLEANTMSEELAPGIKGLVVRLSDFTITWFTK